MSKNMKKTEAILREMVMITLRSELTKIQRTNLETCITIHMHQKESTGNVLNVLMLPDCCFHCGPMSSYSHTKVHCVSAIPHASPDCHIK